VTAVTMTESDFEGRCLPGGGPIFFNQAPLRPQTPPLLKDSQHSATSRMVRGLAWDIQTIGHENGLGNQPEFKDFHSLKATENLRCGYIQKLDILCYR
jgi:hypothetical protein